MTYKETLFFVGKCLTITHENHNKEIVENELKSGNIDWNNVVKLSTSHYVFPALYCNLKRANFLHYLPNDLVEYMKHITDLNRERNQQIIEQAKEVNDLLLANNITPIFLKGTGNLLEGLYEDIAERMVGDIDFLVAKEQCEPAFKLLKKSGYNHIISELFEDHRHLPRITHSSKIAALEIHKEILRKEKSLFFNYQKIKNSLITINNFTFLSYKNQIKLSIYSKLINDYGYLLKNINLRAAYDYFLLGSKLNINTLIQDKHLSKELDAGLSLYSLFLSKPEKIVFTSTPQSELFIKKVVKNLNNNYLVRFNRKLITFYIKLKDKIGILLKAFFLKSYYIFIISRITDINWYKRKLGLKN